MRISAVKVFRTAAIALTAVVSLALTACSPPPPAQAGEQVGAQAVKVADLFAGGSFPFSITVKPQTITRQFTYPGIGTCTATAVTPSVAVRGSVTVAPVMLDMARSRVTLPSAALQVPGTTISAGSLSLRCNNRNMGTIGISLRFDGLASVQSVVLDTGAKTLSLASPTITLTNLRATFAGAPAGTAPTPLAPVKVTVPSIAVRI